MATGVLIATSGDSGAPQLFGSSGSLVSVLDAVLINGYGSISAAGTAGAGAWSIAFTASGKRVYRPSAGNRLYLRVNDSAAGTGGAQEALIKGGESFSDIDTPTNPLPATGQSALTQNSLIVRKSATADSTTGRPWIVAADDRTVYMFIQTGDTANTYLAWMWGDIYSLLTADSYRTMIVGRAAENSGTGGSERLDQYNIAFTTAVAGHFLQRTYAGTGTSITANKAPNSITGTAGTATVGTIAGPNAAGGGYMTLPIFVNEVTPVCRGFLRGLWFGAHTLTSYNDGDVYAGTGDLAGKTFRVIKQSGNSGVFVVESGDTWATSS